LGEQLGSPAEDFLTAFIPGFEVQVKITESINTEHFTGGRGFHTSGTIGIFGATVAFASTMSAGVDASRQRRLQAT
jgi:2-methylcitrate dehydratase PrpD